MTGPEHYRAAEELRDAARNVKDDTDNPDRWEWARYFHDAAKVHLAAALVAATAESIAQKDNGRSPKHDNTISREWTEAIS